MTVPISYADTMFAAGGLLGAGANVYSGIASIRIAEYQQSMLEHYAEYMAEVQRIEEFKIDREIQKTIATQRVQAAANGLMPDVGTPLDVQITTEITGDIDKALMRITGNIERLNTVTAGRFSRAEGYGRAGQFFGKASESLLDTSYYAAYRGGLLEQAPSPMTGR
jgi:hypothetical protein